MEIRPAALKAAAVNISVGEDTPAAAIVSPTPAINVGNVKTLNQGKTLRFAISTPLLHPLNEQYECHKEAKSDEVRKYPKNKELREFFVPFFVFFPYLMAHHYHKKEYK